MIVAASITRLHDNAHCYPGMCVCVEALTELSTRSPRLPSTIAPGETTPCGLTRLWRHSFPGGDVHNTLHHVTDLSSDPRRTNQL